MNDQNKTVNPEETSKDEKLQLTDEEAEKAAGGSRVPRLVYTSKPEEKKIMYRNIQGDTINPIYRKMMME